MSNPLHGVRARLNLQHQRPDLAQRAVRAADYRPGERTLAKPFLTIIGLLELAETQKAARDPLPAPALPAFPASVRWPGRLAGAPETGAMSCFFRCALIPCIYSFMFDTRSMNSCIAVKMYEAAR